MMAIMNHLIADGQRLKSKLITGGNQVTNSTRQINENWLIQKGASRKLIAWFKRQKLTSLLAVVNALTNEDMAVEAGWLMDACTPKRRNQSIGSRYIAKYDKEGSSASPYWDHHRQGENEHVKANPDSLSEEATPWPKRDTTEEHDKQMTAVKAAYAKATEAQCRVVDMVASRGMSFREAADALGLDVSSVRDHMTGFRRRVEKIYKKSAPQNRKVS